MKKVKFKPGVSVIIKEDNIYVVSAPFRAIQLFFESDAKKESFLKLTNLLIKEGVNVEQLREQEIELLKELEKQNILYSFEDKSIEEMDFLTKFLAMYTSYPGDVKSYLNSCNIYVAYPSLWEKKMKDLSFYEEVKISKIVWESLEQLKNSFENIEDDSSVIFFSYYDFEIARAVSSICLEKNLKLLPITASDVGAHFALGPAIEEKDDPCWYCFYLRFQSASLNPEVYTFFSGKRNGLDDITGELLEGFWQFIKPSVLLWILNLDSLFVRGRVIFVNGLELAITSEYVLKVPTCPVCATSRKNKVNYTPFLY